MPNFVSVGHFASVLLSLSLLFSSYTIKYAEGQERHAVFLDQWDQIVLQRIFAAWNRTPDQESNLSGWSTYDPNNNLRENMTSPGFQDPCYGTPWRGVFCSLGGSMYANETAHVTSLKLVDASLVGNFSNDIWEFTQLYSVALSGNPNLRGSFSNSDLQHTPGWPLKKIDLHDNNMDGALPVWLKSLPSLEELDLSNNQFYGSLPLEDMRFLTRMRILKLSKNILSGNISTNVFENWTALVTMDISNNRFSGLFPNLNRSRVLHTLNLSYNEFEGEIHLSDFHSNTSGYLKSLDLSNNKFTGQIPNPSGWFALKSLDLSNNMFTPGPLPTWHPRFNNSLQFLGLSNTSLIGEVDTLSILKNFTKLETLYLDNNNISGILNIHDYFSNSTNNLTSSRIGIMSLRALNMRNNQINDVLYTSRVISLVGVSINLQGNPYCEKTTQISLDLQRCVCEQVCYDSDDIIAKSNKKTIIIAAIVSGLVIAMIILVSTALFWRSQRKNKYLLLAVHKKFAEYEMKPTLYTFGELQKATRDFHVDMKLGEGGFGAVYKGHLTDGSQVAVKQLSTSAQQNMDEFLNEVVLLTGVKHRNLVKLKGCCLHGDRRLLVYEYVENFDLADILFDHKGHELLSWPQRFNICLGIAHGLYYLHALVEPRIIHRDIKASNVLLDKNLQPKIADFGLALLFPNEATHITMMQVAGTKGYLAPEYATLGLLSEKVDVFSFGVLALEIVSGRRNINLKLPIDRAYLLEWAWRLNEGGNLMELVDSSILLQSEEEIEVQQVMNVALACLQTVAERRPTMAQVVAILQGDTDLQSFSDRSSEEGISRSYYEGFLAHMNTLDTGLEIVQEESSMTHTHSSNCPSFFTSDGATVSLELSAQKAR